MTQCSISNCNREYKAKGYCRKHYQHFRLYGTAQQTRLELHGMTGLPEHKLWVDMKRAIIP